MLDRYLDEEQVLRVDERLVRVVRIIVEQYDGDVRAFVESVRCSLAVIRRDESKSNNQGETAWRQHP
jgi:hypothetical protein